MNASTQQALSSSVTLDVQGRRIHLTEAGHGPPLLMLHGGGPGASGMSNYSRNAIALAERFRVIVPDMPGYGSSSKGINAEDPFGDLANSMLGLLDALQIDRAHVMGNSLGGACALRMALDRPERVGRLVLMGPGGVAHLGEQADRRIEAAARVLRRRRPDAGEAAQVHPRRPGLRQQPGHRVAAARALRGQHRTRGGRQSAAAGAEGLGGLQAPRLPARSAAAGAGQPDAGAVGHRGPGQSGERRARAAATHAATATCTCSAAPATGCSGSGRTNSTARGAVFSTRPTPERGG